MVPKQLPTSFIQKKIFPINKSVNYTLKIHFNNDNFCCCLLCQPIKKKKKKVWFLICEIEMMTIFTPK